MKKQKFFSLIAVSLIVTLLAAGCSAEPREQEQTPEPEYCNIDDYYTLINNGDFTYSYTLKDQNGNVLFEKQNTSRLPKTVQAAPAVFGIVTQTGTGLSTNWAVYCDVENSLVSEYFYYVLGAIDNYVVYADYMDGEHFIVIQDMFDGEGYYTKIKLKNVSSVAADFALGCRFDEEGNAIVTYLTGEDYTETEITITIP